MHSFIIKGIIETSLLDWEGKVVTTLFTPGCNFRCPYCQNAGLVLRPRRYKTISLSTIADHLLKYKNWIDGICLTGGEPCLYEDIDEFLQEIKRLKFGVKLDTNGAFPEVIERLIRKKLVDYVAMDVKAPIENSSKLEAQSSKLKDDVVAGLALQKETKYQKATGIKVDIEKIKESINIIMKSKIDYEFRTTVVPTLHTPEDILAIARWINGAKKYSLQNFSNKEPMNPDFKKIIPYKREELEEMKNLAFPLVKECVVRG
ncbi:anaerobic ribonucleoside-triphosphate reductase activating protein [Candidatus Desantisbacteria bacterium CG1_02_38_46]|uniref:Anaerobic ribonucleoside-triphosphate reductase activating protein n=2 Tax=unclassified Candidatus Desantisiibacteriota TaxID=3106372 RepID=A0A2H9PC00_9BACT|nr:MAG: anaerobic ribonucleoside-triphosphate reductase activating protein [Candidatus Desantisbacteria bacterium CG1_02_38_46]PIZ16543.1 MAG: anaerobic ribonucleoside-triphosphate reductase activating protein [Candidatus Desantisbacteria bacterium CG_4_10_14_0_8_um_filter_39_17]